ncbi:MAG: tetratricopeptide repeat protein [Alphaproteobacteria bacterium]|nr:tetratricopeptide repeat protein [Alphaproteobacteria bacterium]
METQKALTYLEDGRGYIKQEKYVLALECFQKAKQINPNSSVIHNAIGTTYIKNKDYGKGIKSLKKSIKLNTENLFPYLNLGKLYIVHGKSAKLKKITDRLLCTYPRNIEASIWLSTFCASPRDLNLFMEYADNSLETKPQNSTGLSIKGVCFSGKGQHDLATEYLEQALHVETDYNIVCYGILSLSYMEQGKHDKAGETYNRAGIIYYQMGKEEEAITAYNTAININPSSPHPYANLGALHQNEWEFETAIKKFDQALNLDVGHVNSHLGLGISYCCLDKVNRAIPFLQKSQKNNLSKEDAVISSAFLTLSHKNFREAEHLFLKALQNDPENAVLFFGLGKAYGGMSSQVEAAKKAGL